MMLDDYAQNRDDRSIPKASAANVSMMRFTHKSCTAVSTDSSSVLATAEMNVRSTAVMLTVSWN